MSLVLRMLLALAVALAATAQPLFESQWTVESHNGVLEVLLIDDVANVTVAGNQVLLRSWNGSFTGPMLKAKRGDLIKVYLYNKLDEPTNLHFHGFHISPKIPEDDSKFVLVAGSDKIKLYEFTIPMTHPQGMFWYHSHAMPNTEWQIFNGMSGPFVIDGMLDDLPELATAVKKYVLLRDFQFSNPDKASFVGEDPTTRLVNEQIFPNLSCPLNEVQIWEIANIGADLTYLLEFDTMDGTYTTLINASILAVDGILRTHLVPFPANYTLGPANRVSLLVRCPSVETTLKLVNNWWTNGIDIFPASDLIQINAAGVSSNNITSISLTLPQYIDYRTLNNITQTRTFYFSQAITVEGAGDDDDGYFFINSKTYSTSRIDVRIFLGAVERWVLINSSPEVHYFHIHQGTFQVLSIDGVAQDFEGYQDTVIMPVADPAVKEFTVTEIIVAFNNPAQVGKSFFHCHIEGHADGGMMATFEVMNGVTVDVVFVAIAVPVLFIIFSLSTSYLGLLWYREGKLAAKQPAPML